MNGNIAKLLKEETGDGLVASKATVSCSKAASPDQVWETVRSFSCTSGWLCLTDRVMPLYGPADLAQVTGGIILSGELANGSESLHIRQDENGWNLARITSGTGEECLMIAEEYIGTETRQQDRLRYEVYWKLENGSYRPWVARLSAVEKGGTQ